MRRFFLALLGCTFLALPAAADDHEPAFDPTARQKPMQVITRLDSKIADDTWVIMIYEVENATATQFVPILRPLVPQNGHLVAHPGSNTLMIADSYGNIRKLIRIVEIMDSATPPQSK